MPYAPSSEARPSDIFSMTEQAGPKPPAVGYPIPPGVAVNERITPEPCLVIILPAAVPVMK